MAYHNVLRAQHVLAARKIRLRGAGLVQYKVSNAADADLFRHIVTSVKSVDRYKHYTASAASTGIIFQEGL